MATTVKKSNGLHGLRISVNKKFKSLSSVISYMTDPKNLEAKIYLQAWNLEPKQLTPHYLKNGAAEFLTKSGKIKTDFGPWWIMGKIAEIQTARKVTAKSLTSFKEAAEKDPNNGEAAEFLKIIAREEAAAADRVKKIKESNAAKKEEAEHKKNKAIEEARKEAAKKKREEAAKKK